MTWKKLSHASFLLSIISLAIVLSCRSRIDQPTVNEASVAGPTSETPPFKTQEPDRYQAVRTVTIISPSSATVVATSFVARDGQLRREESQVDGKTIVYLNSLNGFFVLLPDAKIYAETAGDEPVETVANEFPLENSPERLLHADQTATSYEYLGQEILNDRNVNKYRALVNSPASGNVTITLIWVDADLGMPVKSETKGTDGTRSVMELTKISREVDRTLFEIPKYYEKVTASVIRQKLKGE